MRHLGAAVVGHQHGLHADDLVEQEAGQPGGDGAGAEVELAGIRLGLADQVLNRLHLARRIDDQQLHGLGDQGDRREVGDWIVWRRAVQKLVHRQRRIDRVRWRLSHPVPGDERELERFDPDPARAGRILEGSVDRVLQQAEHVHRGAPPGRVTGIRADGDRPRRPRDPTRRIELQLHERRPRVVR